MFTDQKLKEIRAALDATPLGSANFEIRRGDDSLFIEAKGEPDYYFDAAPNTVSPYAVFGEWHRFAIAESPGETEFVERFETNEPREIIQRIPAWAKRVAAEIDASRDIIAQERFSTALDHYVAEHYSDNQEPIHSEDYEKIVSELDALKRDVEKLHAEHKVTTDQLAEITEIVDRLVSEAPKTRGAVWLRKLAGTVGTLTKIAADNPHLFQRLLQLTEHAGKLLGM